EDRSGVGAVTAVAAGDGEAEAGRFVLLAGAGFGVGGETADERDLVHGVLLLGSWLVARAAAPGRGGPSTRLRVARNDVERLAGLRRGPRMRGTDQRPAGATTNQQRHHIGTQVRPPGTVGKVQAQELC